MAAMPQQRSFTSVPTTSGRRARTSQRTMDSTTLNRSLGWFSIALGVTEILAPRALGRAIGVGGDHSVTMRVFGAREIAAGVGLLSGRAPATFAMARVAGDVMDLTMLGAALTEPRANPKRIAATVTAVAGVTALDLYASNLDARAALRDASAETPLSVSITINSTPEKLYEFWRKFDNLPRFMRHLRSVESIDERTSRWVANGPGDTQVHWRSEIVEDQPNRFISWRTLPNSEVNHRGSVRFEAAPNGRGVVVRVKMHYGTPNGRLAGYAAKLMGAAPEAAIREDLRRFKQLIEAGEIPTTRGQPSGARSLLGKTFRRALPEENA